MNKPRIGLVGVGLMGHGIALNIARKGYALAVLEHPGKYDPPGSTGEINVEFNSKGKPGMQSKRVTVTANTNPTETFLEIKGEVRPKEQPTAKGEKK